MFSRPATSSLLALIAVLASLVTAACPAHAQRATPPPRVAAVLSTAPAMASARLSAFQQGMKDHGYVDGQNVQIDVRSWLGETRPLTDLAADVVRSRPPRLPPSSKPPDPCPS